MISQYLANLILDRYEIARQRIGRQNCLGFAFYVVGIEKTEQYLLLEELSKYHDRIRIVDDPSDAVLVGAVLKDAVTYHLWHVAVLDPRDESRTTVLQREQEYGEVKRLPLNQAFERYERTGKEIKYFALR